MILYTIIPPEDVFADDGEGPTLVEARVGGLDVLVEPLENGRGRVERILSTDPDRYLDPTVFPGAVVSYAPKDVNGLAPFRIG